MSTLVVEAPFAATERQQELADAWYGDAREILACGAVRSGKTQAAARLLVESALEQPSLYVVARQTYGELKDSTQRAMLEGDGQLPPLIPRECRDTRYGTLGFHTLDNECRLVNGSAIRFRNLEHAHVWLNTSLGGILIDQAEEMDEGPEGERLYDTILARLSDPGGLRKIMLVANPGPLTHWLHKRFLDPRTLHPRTAYVQFRLHDNAENLPADLVESLEETREFRPHWYRTFVLGEWGAFEGAAFEEFDTGLHVVPVFALPDEWLRLEGMDHGSNNPTAWLLAGQDYDGNTLVWDEYYQPGLVSAHAAEVLRRREHSWWAKDGAGSYAATFADPSIRSRYGISDITGRELSVEIEYSDHGIAFVPGQNDRRAGYARLLELIHPDQARTFPAWHPRAGENGSPRLFITRRCEHLIEQIQSAPVLAEGKDALDVVDPKWESQHGHSLAALRYMAMGRAGASDEPEEMIDDPRREYLVRMREQWDDDDA